MRLDGFVKVHPEPVSGGAAKHEVKISEYPPNVHIDPFDQPLRDLLLSSQALRFSSDATCARVMVPWGCIADQTLQPLGPRFYGPLPEHSVHTVLHPP